MSGSASDRPRLPAGPADPVPPAARSREQPLLSRLSKLWTRECATACAIVSLVALAIVSVSALGRTSGSNPTNPPSGQDDLLRQSLDEARKAREDARQAQNHWQELVDRVAALQRAVDQRATPLSKDQEQQLAELKKALAAWDGEFKDVKTALDKLALRSADPSEAFVKQIVGKTASGVEEVIARNFEQALSNLQKDASNLLTILKAFEHQLRREAAARDVALILFHNKNIDAALALPVVKEVVEGHPYRRNYANYRLGVYVAGNRQILKAIRPLEALERPLDDPNKPGTSAKDYNPILEKRTQIIDQPDQLDVVKEVFAKAARADKTPYERRCVLVLGADCEPPANKVEQWNGLVVHVILIEVARPKDAGNPKVAQRLAAWEQFCRQYHGAAALVRVLTEDARLSPEDQEALKLRLQWSISPY